MNKYQEALKTLSKYAHESPNVGWALIHEENIIQELVDKETPMKPYIPLGGRDSVGFPIDGLCGKCGKEVKKRFTGCPNCSQKIDWEEKE